MQKSYPSALRLHFNICLQLQERVDARSFVIVGSHPLVNDHALCDFRGSGLVQQVASTSCFDLKVLLQMQIFAAMGRVWTRCSCGVLRLNVPTM
eukprot:642934-Amphidinium_carterae.1